MKGKQMKTLIGAMLFAVATQAYPQRQRVAAR
jgi:hypothetical protein